MKAPLARQMVIGDSRVFQAPEPATAQFVGYGGATFESVSRISRVLCAIHDGPVTIALGVNDANTRHIDIAASEAAMAQLVEDCARPGLTLAKIWPIEVDRRPHGSKFDVEAITRLNETMSELAQSKALDVLPAPRLETGFTEDGIHFTPQVSASFGRWLIGEPAE
ncbi:SGNH/GDSL hydrolase family protein [Aurantiacibacter sp. MUD61]|uniref:SGNH/GDSL hydrolase family protein n=1 Tax=Aurantiacibacter sp. MUD61 TaxID=3009083 RepID=UPI0022EFE8F4|nr:SGNH/GDSL hydrolase family protein [Aurantiacibacter sp. MUD61]